MDSLPRLTSAGGCLLPNFSNFPFAAPEIQEFQSCFRNSAGTITGMGLSVKSLVFRVMMMSSKHYFPLASYFTLEANPPTNPQD